MIWYGSVGFDIPIRHITGHFRDDLSSQSLTGVKASQTNRTQTKLRHKT